MERLKSTERRMKLILLLQQSKERLTADALAERFGVTKRTIYRDLNTLSELNVPVTHDPFHGYGVIDGYSIPPLMFTPRELATIMVGLNFVKSQVDKNLAQDAKGVELKVKELLPDKLKSFMNSLHNKTIVDPFLNFGHEKKEGGNWYIISSAISEHQTVRFTYRSVRQRTTTQRKVDPYLLVFYKDHWNMIGFSHLRNEIRNFVLDQVTNIEMTDEKFIPKTEMNAEALIFNSVDTGEKVVLHVHKSADRAFKANLPTKIIKQTPINTKINKVELQFDNLDFLNNWLLQFGEHVYVESPDELIHKRRELLGRLHKTMEKGIV